MVGSMRRFAIVFALGLLAASPSFASMRCGGSIVSEGDSRMEVAARCGEPDDVIAQKSVYRRPVIWTQGRPYFIGEDFMEVTVESWIYNFGPNKLMRKLRFEGGVLTDIETMGYGYHKK
jgi:hypothetical protein